MGEDRPGVLVLWARRRLQFNVETSLTASEGLGNGRGMVQRLQSLRINPRRRFYSRCVPMSLRVVKDPEIALTISATGSSVDRYKSIIHTVDQVYLIGGEGAVG